MTKQELIQSAIHQAQLLKIDPSLVCAVCEQESSWEPNAIRFEAQFYEHYEMKKDLADSEELNRSASFGLMQILGETARNLGFSEDFRVLYDPEVNLYLGCRKLRLCLDESAQQVRLALLHYNGGGDKHYPDRVLARQPKYSLMAQGLEGIAHSA